VPIRCDIALTNAHILTMDDQFTVWPSGSIAITGDAIVEVGDLGDRYRAEETVDCRGRVVMPGLINAHTHAPMTLLRGLADDLRLDVWLMGYMMPVERAFVSPEFVRLGTRLGCAEMIRSGVTCFADMYYFEDAIAEATAAAGMRALCAQTVLRFPTPDATSFEESLALARDFIQRWRGHALIVPGPAPHAPYTCTRRSCAPARSWRWSSTYRCTSTCPKPPRKWMTRGGSMVRRWCHGPRSTVSSRRRSWRRIACTWTTGRCGR